MEEVIVYGEASTALISGHDNNDDSVFLFIPICRDEEQYLENQRRLDKLQRQREEEERLKQEREEAEMKRKKAEMKREKRERKLFKYEDDLNRLVEEACRQKKHFKNKRRDRRMFKLEQIKIHRMELEMLEKELNQSLNNDDAVYDLPTTDHRNDDSSNNEDHNEASPVESSSFATFNVKDLFDFSTLDNGNSADGGSDRGTRKVIKRETIKLQRLVLGKRGVHMEVDQYVMLDVDERLQRRSPVKLETLKLNIIKDCNSIGAFKGNTPSMPLLRLEMLEKEWQEPIRSRDKNWVVHSQRQILLKDSSLDVSDDYNAYKQLVKNKKYEKEMVLPDAEWHQNCKTFVRTVRLARESFKISETSCLIDIYGTGINGRLFAGGKGSGQMIKMDIFSFWNSEKFTFSFTLADIKRLFINQPDLIKAGCKDKIINGLLKRLYFKYTITVTPPTALEDQTVHVIEVTHLEKPKLPQFLHSNSVMDIITMIQGVQEQLPFPVPVLKQELKIGTEERPNGMIQRLKTYQASQRKLEEDERLKREKWLKTPKRFRGYVRSSLLRMKGHFVIVSTYRMPNRQNNIIVKGVTPIRCTKVNHYLGLSFLGQIFGIKTSSKTWDEEFVKAIVTKAMKSMMLTDKVIVEETVKTRLYSLCIGENNGTEVALAHLEKGKFLQSKSVTMEAPDAISDCVKVPTFFSRNKGKEELEKNCRMMIPRRHLGLEKIHLTTKAVKIDSVFCIYSVYIRNLKWKLNKTTPAPTDNEEEKAASGATELESTSNDIKSSDKKKKTKKEKKEEVLDDNVTIFNSVAFEVDFEFYVPHESYVDGHIIAPSTIYKTTMSKEDFFFFVKNEHIPRLQVALTVLKDGFFLNASHELLGNIQEEWGFLCADFISSARFRLRYHETSVDSGLVTKINKADKLLSIDLKNSIEESPVDVNVWPPVPFVVLSIKAGVVYNKNIVIQSMDEHRQKPIIQASMWIKGNNMGIIAVDPLKKDIYFMEPSQAIQKAQVESLRWIPAKERIILASLFIQFSTIWNTVFDEDGSVIRTELQWIDMSADTTNDEEKLNG